jgi:hypothetical protein
MGRIRPTAAGFSAALLGVLVSAPTATRVCQATHSDPLPPYYRPGAPLRSQVGVGYALSGAVRAAATCRPIPRARVEYFLANPEGEYDNDHRGTLFASARGTFRLVSNFPGRFRSLPPHIHLRVSVRGFAPLVTEHHPVPGTHRGTIALYLLPLTTR